MKRAKVKKEPGLLKKIIEIHYEQRRRRKAITTLQKQEWSFDFLALLLVKASKLANKNLSLVIKDKAGVSYTLSYDNANRADTVQSLDDSIFNHLDDDIAIQEFINNNSSR